MPKHPHLYSAPKGGPATEAFLGQVYRALTKSPNWPNTVLVVTRDEWGGFFDTIVPPRMIAPNDLDSDLVNGKALVGCRVPVVIASPFSRGTPTKPTIDRTMFDHTSILKLIEWRWGLPALTKRDAATKNLALALSFSKPNLTVPSLPNIPVPVPSPCGEGGILDGSPLGTTDSYQLLHSSLMEGWPLPAGLP